MKPSKPIALKPKFQRLVDKTVQSGRFQSPSEVVEAALSLFDAREREHEARLKAMDASIDRGLADARAGRYTDFDDAAVERIKQRGRARLAVDRRKKSA